VPKFVSLDPSRKFVLKGINCNRPIDALPDGQVPFAQNIRSYREGSIVTRPGLTLLSNTFNGAAGPKVIHSGFTLDNFQGPGSSVRLIGYNTQMFVADTNTPPVAVLRNDPGWAGTPMSFVGTSPREASSPWAYVYDSAQQAKYCSDYPAPAGLLTKYPIGLAGIQTPLTGPWIRPTITKVAGGLTGNYFYKYRLRDQKTGVYGQPGPPTYSGSPVTLAAQSARMTMPSIVDTGISGPGWTGYYTIDIFRFGGLVNAWKLIGSAPSDGATVFTDNMSDTAAVGALLEDLTVFEPWITTAIPYLATNSSVAAASAGTGSGDGFGSIITRGVGDPNFNNKWLPGTPVLINDSIPGSLLRMISVTQIELNEDLGVIAAPVKVSITGALVSGVPLPYVWGPYGAGFFGLYLFGCGDPNRPGTLYWTNGNDPDSTQPNNSLDLTSPSEPLQNGCIYNGSIYVWSTERMFIGTPDLVNPGQFIFQVLPGARGLLANWAFCVGDYMYWKSKDGIYRSSGSLPESITDAEMYPFFPHDGIAAGGLQVPNPDNFAAPIQIPPADPSKPQFERLSWGDGNLRYDYVDTGGNAQTLHWMKFPGEGVTQHGWLYDVYGVAVGFSRFAWWEEVIGPTQLNATYREFVAIGSSWYSWSSVDNKDDGVVITGKLMTAANDLGQAREPKLIGDAWINALIGFGGITAQPVVKLLGDNNASVIATGTLPDSASLNRASTVLDVNGGLGTLSRTVGLWFTWTFGAEVLELFEYNYYFVGKPESTQLRATDWTTDGYNGAKYLKAVVIKANPLGTTRTVNVQVQSDVGGVTTAATLTIASATDQTEVPYAITPPIVAQQFRLVPTDANAWELFDDVRWVWDQYPEFLAQTEDYTPDKFDGPKYVRGVMLEGDTNNTAVTFNFEYDGGTVLSLGSITQNGRLMTYIGFATPIRASEIRIRPLGKWRRHPGTRFIYDNYPDFAALITSWSQEGGNGRSRRIYGGVLHVDTNNVSISLQLQGDGGAVLATVAGVSANGQSEFPFALTTPVFAHLTRWVPVSAALWSYWDTTWDQEIYPELLAEVTPSEDGGAGNRARYIRGGIILADTNNVVVSAQLKGDNGATLATVTGIQASGKSGFAFALTPPVVSHETNWVPGAAWRYFLTTWDQDIYPEIIPELTAWNDGGAGGRTRYIRGGIIRVDTGGALVSIQLHGDNDAVIGTISVQSSHQDDIPFAFVPPVFAHLTRWVPQSANVRIWNDATVWDQEVYPEYLIEESPVITLNRNDAAFVQGFKIPADSSNLSARLQVLFDGGQSGPILTSTWNGKQVQYFPNAANPFLPFVAHTIQVIPLDAIRVFWPEMEVIFEPLPELATMWQTQETDHDIPGWHYLRDCYIAYQSAPGATVDEVLTITTEYGALTYNLPASTSYARRYLILQPQKAKWRKYQVASTLGVRLFRNDIAVRGKGWYSGSGANGQWFSFNPFQPIGDASRAVGARI